MVEAYLTKPLLIHAVLDVDLKDKRVKSADFC
jgi:hypothetical protein